MKNVVHLVDDRTAGGVTRMLAFLTTVQGLDFDQKIIDFKDWRKGLKSRPDVIVSHLSISWRKLPAFLALRAIFPNTPLIHVEHSYTLAFTALNVTKRARFFALLRASYAIFDKVVAVSEAQSNWLRDRKLVPVRSLETIQSMVDLEPFGAVPFARHKPIVLGIVGRLDRQKGFDVAIKAFRLLENPDIRLRIYGKGPEEGRLRLLSGVDPRITFCGFVQAPEDAYAEVDAILMPSRWEAFGLVASEANAAGRPVLAAAVDGLNDHSGQGMKFVSGHSHRLWATQLARFCATEFAMKPIDALSWKRQKMAVVRDWRSLFQSQIA